MKRIKIEKWKAKNPKDGTEVEENTINALNLLINLKKPDEIPRGLDKFRLFNRLSKAFDAANESGELVLEESDYQFLKDAVEKDIPSQWGMNPDIHKAIESFLNAKSEEDKK